MFSMPLSMHSAVLRFIVSRSSLPSSSNVVTSVKSPNSVLARSPTMFPLAIRSCALSSISFSSGLYLSSQTILGHCRKLVYFDFEKYITVFHLFIRYI